MLFKLRGLMLSKKYHNDFVFFELKNSFEEITE